MDADLLKYLPAMLSLDYQGMVYAVTTKEGLADLTYKDFQTLKFNIKLPANQYMNWNTVHICLPIKIKSSINEANDIAANIITVIIFFAHWIKKMILRATEMILKFYQQIIQQTFIGIQTQF